MTHPTVRPMMTLQELKLLVRKLKSQMMTDPERRQLDRLRARLEETLAGHETGGAA